MTIKEKVKKLMPKFLLEFYHYLFALFGAMIFCFPGKSKNVKIIGVTGTGGKSTTIQFLSEIFEEAHIPIASQSSVRFKIKNTETQNKLKMTMPGRFFMQKFLRDAVNQGCKYIILEVTSEGIKQFRHKFINFDTAVFTNLSPEHIESHGGFENYKKAKGKLFLATKDTHVINIDDENSDYFLKFTAKKKITFGKNQGDFNLQNTEFKVQMNGDFNYYNALAAICVARNYGIDFEICKKAVESLKGIPGRMEEVISEPFKVFVDFAFTPDALEKVYKTFEGKNLVCVLGGTGGGRDKWRWPVLGEIANKYCKEIFVTNEDPYDEDPMEIINEVAKTAPNAKKILDRREAIGTAIKLAKPKDVVIITGKGSEPLMCLANGKKIPWDDRQIVRDAYKEVESLQKR
ncbi:MAG: Mur ligase family protein [Candidatus Staskawiczbacteria bacterium]|nr:Mur ligase family protein [Candidatus Staskawiczbacteria bacterium]